MALVRYLRESKQELEKVTWPTRKETMQYTALTIVVSVVFAAYFGLLDFLLNAGFAALLETYV